MHPDERAVRFGQPQLVFLWFARLKELFPVQVVDVLILFEDEAGDRLPDQRAAGHAQQCGSGEVGFQEQSMLRQGAVAHRGQVIEVEIARPPGFDLLLGRAKLLVLHLQFDLVHPEFMKYLFDCFRGLRGQEYRFQSPGLLLGPFSQLRRIGGRQPGVLLLVAHRRSSPL